MSKLVLMAFAVMTTAAAVGQTKAVISLKGALNTALVNYPELKSKRYLVASAEATVTDAEHQELPAFFFSDQVDLGTDNGAGGSYFPMGIIPSTSGGIRTDNITSTFSGNLGVAYLQHELYNFGLNGARIDAARSLVDFSNADYQESTYLLQYHVAQLYFELLRYRLLVDVQQKNIDRYSVLYNYIKAFTKSGIKPGVDSSIANAEVSRARIEYVQSSEAYRKLKQEFLYYTGYKVADFDIDTTLYGLPEERLGRMQQSVAGESVDNGNPVLAFYNNRWEYSLSQENLISKSYLPKLYLVGSAWMRGSSISPKDVFGSLSTGLDYSRYNYMAGIALTYNIVDLLHQSDRTTIQHLQTESMQQDAVQQRTELEHQLQQADIAIQAVMEREREIPRLLSAAQNVFAQKSAQYNAGIANITELEEASYLLYKAEIDEVELLPDLLNTLLNKAVTNNTLNAFLTNF